MTNVYEIKKKFNLKPKEIQFLHEHLENNLSITQAYKATKKIKSETKQESIRRSASRFYSKIKSKIDWNEFLEISGLGLNRIAKELNKMLSAKKTVFYKGEAVAICEDNTNQVRALELLAELWGKRITQLEHSGVVILKPETIKKPANAGINRWSEN